jgi:hypothetical protein
MQMFPLVATRLFVLSLCSSIQNIGKTWSLVLRQITCMGVCNNEKDRLPHACTRTHDQEQTKSIFSYDETFIWLLMEFCHVFDSKLGTL